MRLIMLSTLYYREYGRNDIGFWRWRPASVFWLYCWLCIMMMMIVVIIMVAVTRRSRTSVASVKDWPSCGLWRRDSHCVTLWCSSCAAAGDPLCLWRPAANVSATSPQREGCNGAKTFLLCVRSPGHKTALWGTAVVHKYSRLEGVYRAAR